MSTRTKRKREREAGGSAGHPDFVIPPPGTPRLKIFALVSSANDDWMPEWPKPWRKERGDTPGTGWGNHFLYGGTQINCDLATVAACEKQLVLDFGGDEPNGFDMLRSPMYWKLRQSFVESAARGDSYAFARAIYRAYMAGRMSPDRLLPPEGEPVRLKQRGASGHSDSTEHEA